MLICSFRQYHAMFETGTRGNLARDPVLSTTLSRRTSPQSLLRKCVQAQQATATIKLAACLALGLLAAFASAQSISFQGNSGCAVLKPTAPTNLKAQAGDQEVTLTWDKPGNGGWLPWDYKHTHPPAANLRKGFRRRGASARRGSSCHTCAWPASTCHTAAFAPGPPWALLPTMPPGLGCFRAELLRSSGGLSCRPAVGCRGVGGVWAAEGGHALRLQNWRWPFLSTRTPHPPPPLPLPPPRACLQGVTAFGASWQNTPVRPSPPPAQAPASTSTS